MDNNTVELAALMAEISVLETDVEGMKAENKHREINDESMAYTENDFSYIAQQMADIAEKMRKLKQ